MASIGAELSLAQQFEPLVFISRVLNPWVIGFAGVIVICAASNYSPGGPPGAPAALCGDREPKSSHGTRSGGTKGSWHAGMSTAWRMKQTKLELELGVSSGRGRF